MRARHAVVQLLRRTNVVLDEAAVPKKFGVSPESIRTISRWSATLRTAIRVCVGGERSRLPQSSPSSTSRRHSAGLA